MNYKNTPKQDFSEKRKIIFIDNETNFEKLQKIIITTTDTMNP